MEPESVIPVDTRGIRRIIAKELADPVSKLARFLDVGGQQGESLDLSYRTDEEIDRAIEASATQLGYTDATTLGFAKQVARAYRDAQIALPRLDREEREMARTLPARGKQDDIAAPDDYRAILEEEREAMTNTDAAIGARAHALGAANAPFAWLIVPSYVCNVRTGAVEVLDSCKLPKDQAGTRIDHWYVPEKGWTLNSRYANSADLLVFESQEQAIDWLTGWIKEKRAQIKAAYAWLGAQEEAQTGREERLAR